MTARSRQTSIHFLICLLIVGVLFRVGRGEDQYNNWNYDNYDNGGGGNDDDGMQAYNNYNYQNDGQNGYEGGQYQQGDDYIQYWTDYAILPKRCIV